MLLVALSVALLIVLLAGGLLADNASLFRRERRAECKQTKRTILENCVPRESMGNANAIAHLSLARWTIAISCLFLYAAWVTRPPGPH